MTGLAPAPRGARDEELDTLLDFIRERTGLALPERFGSPALVRRAMARANCGDVSTYRERIERDPAEMQTLLTELTVGETYFLRERGQLEFIRSEVMPAWRRSFPSRRFAAWSAGCATGEEAYSIAIIADEAGMLADTTVLGTDLVGSRLDAARRGLYGKWSMRGMAVRELERFFELGDALYEVAPRLRAAVKFRELDLVSQDWSSLRIQPGSMDLILCRNVLIYLDSSVLERLMHQLFGALSPEGWLFLGASDPSLADYVKCEVVVTGAGIAFRATAPSGAAQRIPVAKWVKVPQPQVAPPAISTNAARPSEAPPPRQPIAHERAEADTEPTLVRMLRLDDAGRSAEACDLARDIVSADPAILDAWIVLVRGLADTGRFVEAGIACATALDIHRTSPALAYLHAMLLRQGGLTSEAIGALRRVLYLDPNFALAHVMLGDLLALRGAADEARRAYRNAERALAAAPSAEDSQGLSSNYLISAARLRSELLDEQRRQ